MDNIRSLLIFLVVIGHFFEISGSLKIRYLTEFIYSFHMPVFVFISGYFAKFHPKRIFIGYIYPYVLLQLIYNVFTKYYLNGASNIFIMSMPQFTLWYLLAMAFYCMLIPFITTNKAVLRWIVFAISAVVSIISGFDTGIEYSFAMGRFFTFLPFFVAGHYAKDIALAEKIQGMRIGIKSVCAALLAIAVVVVETVILKSKTVGLNELYGVFAYVKTGDTWHLRVFLMVVGFVWIGFLLFSIPNIKVPLLTVVGQNTFPIYIFHGFFIKILMKNNITHMSALHFFIVTALISVVIVLVFGNKIGSAVAKWGFTGHWITALIDKDKEK